MFYDEKVSIFARDGRCEPSETESTLTCGMDLSVCELTTLRHPAAH